MSSRLCAVWPDLCLTRWVSELHNVSFSTELNDGHCKQTCGKTAESKQQSAVLVRLKEYLGRSRRMRVWKNEGIDGKARNGSVLLMFCSIVRRDGLRPHIGVHTFVCCEEEEGSQWAKKEAMCYTRIELKKAGSRHILVLTVPRRFQKAPPNFRTWIREKLLKVTSKALKTA